MSGGIPAPALIYCKSYYIYYKSYPTSNPRRPEGAADFPCLRQLPPPPEKKYRPKYRKI